MYFAQYLKNLRIGARKRELVFWSMPLGSAVYGIIPEEAHEFLKILLFGILFITIGYIVFKGIKFSKNMSLEGLNQIEIPELQEFLNKMGLKLSIQPFWETDNKKIKAWARGDAKNPRIIFGKDYLKSLTSEEKLFVAGHEFFHLKGYEFLHYLIILIPIGIFVFYSSILLHVPDEIMYVGIIGAMIGGMCFTKRSFESIADINGTLNVRKDIAISALKKAYLDKEGKSFFFHPGIQDRINNLDNYFNK